MKNDMPDNQRCQFLCSNQRVLSQPELLDWGGVFKPGSDFRSLPLDCGHYSNPAANC